MRKKVRKVKSTSCILDTDAVDVVIYTRRVSKYLEEECHRGFGEWKFELCNSGRIFIRLKGKIQWKG